MKIESLEGRVTKCKGRMANDFSLESIKEIVEKYVWKVYIHQSMREYTQILVVAKDRDMLIKRLASFDIVRKKITTIIGSSSLGHLFPYEKVYKCLLCNITVINPLSKSDHQCTSHQCTSHQCTSSDDDKYWENVVRNCMTPEDPDTPYTIMRPHIRADRCVTH